MTESGPQSLDNPSSNDRGDLSASNNTWKKRITVFWKNLFYVLCFQETYYMFCFIQGKEIVSAEPLGNHAYLGAYAPVFNRFHMSILSNERGKVVETI